MKTNMIMAFKKFPNKFLVHMKTFDVTIDHILVHFLGSKLGLYVSFRITLYLHFLRKGVNPFCYNSLETQFDYMTQQNFKDDLICWLEEWSQLFQISQNLNLPFQNIFAYSLSQNIYWIRLKKSFSLKGCVNLTC